MNVTDSIQLIANAGAFVGISLILIFRTCEQLEYCLCATYALLAFSFILYSVSTFRASPVRFLQNRMSMSEARMHVSQLRAAHPELAMDLVCSHEEFQGKHRITAVTHRANRLLVYKSWKDTSPVGYSEPELRYTRRPLLLKLKLTVDNLEDGTTEDLEDQRRDFVAQNSRDKQQEYREEVRLAGLKRRVFVSPTQGEQSALFSPAAYFVFSALLLGAAYTRWFSSRCHVIRLSVRKTISTRQDLGQRKRSDLELRPSLLSPGEFSHNSATRRRLI